MPGEFGPAQWGPGTGIKFVQIVKLKMELGPAGGVPGPVLNLSRSRMRKNTFKHPLEMKFCFTSLMVHNAHGPY